MHGEGVETHHYSLSWKSADTCADISATQSATAAAANGQAGPQQTKSKKM